MAAPGPERRGRARERVRPALLATLLLAAGTVPSRAAVGPAAVNAAAGDPAAREPAARGQAPATVPAVNGAPGAYLAGRFAASEADHGAAYERLAEALRQDGEVPDILRAAFGAAVMDGRMEAARLARRLPDDQFAAMLLAGADAQAGRWDRAEARLRALPRQGGAQILQPLLVAWALVGRGQSEAALVLLRPWTESGPLQGLAALHAAMIADLAARPRDAERFARLAMAATPEPNLRLVTVLAGVLARAGRENDGAALFDAMARGHDDVAMVATPEARRAALAGRAVAGPAEGMAEAQVALGGTLRAQGMPKLSLMLARLALRLRPGFAPAVLLAAESLADDAHPEAALALLAAVPAADPLHRLAALRRAMLLDRVGQVEESLDALRALVADHPALVQPRVRLGDVLRARARYDEAVSAYDGALSRVRGTGAADWPLHYARGIALERSNDWPRAETEFRRALALSPDQPYVLNYLGYSMAERGVNLDEARRLLERAVALRPEDGNVADSLGWAMFRQGDVSGAVRLLERAVELESRSATVNDHLGDAYWAAGRRNEARFQWSRALSLDPEPDEIPRLQTKLRDGVQAASTH